MDGLSGSESVISGWSLTLYETAEEAGGAWVSGRRTARPYVPAGEASDPERAVAEAARRARGKIRRYCTAHRLNRLGTLTYRGEGNHAGTTSPSSRPAGQRPAADEPSATGTAASGRPAAARGSPRPGV